MKYCYKDYQLNVKDVDEKKGIVTGYFSNFNSIDSDGDIIRKGAFTKTISEQGPFAAVPRIKHLLNHDTQKPLGKLLGLAEDEKGLYYESQVGSHSGGKDFIEMIKSGLITEHSIGFQTIKYNQIKPWSDWHQGEAARELTELKLYEGSSLTAWGANMYTPLTGMKAYDKINKFNNRIDIMIKAMRSGNFTDETFQMLEIELRQLQQTVIDMTIVPEKESTQPVDFESAVNNFIKTLNF